MNVLAFKRAFPESVEFKSLKPGESTKLLDEGAEPPTYYYPPEVYLTFTRAVEGRPLTTVKDEIAQAMHSWLAAMVPPGAERVVFSIRGPSLAESITYHERPCTDLDDHEIFGYLILAGTSFTRVGVRMLMPRVKSQQIAWSPKALPRRGMKKAD